MPTTSPVTTSTRTSEVEIALPQSKRVFNQTQHTTDDRTLKQNSSLQSDFVPFDSTTDPPKSYTSRRIGDISTFIQSAIGELLSLRIINACYARYCQVCGPAFSAVMCNESAATVQANKPLLFLAMIVATSSSFCDSITQNHLNALLTRALTHSFLRNIRTNAVELLQALIISALWHRPADMVDTDQDSMDLRELSQAAANVAILSGVGKQAQQSEASSVEAARVWLGCYYICANASMVLPHPENILDWSGDMDNALNILQSSAAAVPTDKIFCEQVRLQHATALCSRHFSAMRASDVQQLSPQMVAAKFESEMAGQGLTESEIIQGDPALCLSYQACKSHVYEIAMSTYRETHATSATPSAQPQVSIVSGAPTFAMLECLRSAQAVIATFNASSVQNIGALPTIILIRVVHAVVLMVQSYNEVTERGGPLSPEIDGLFDDMIDRLALWGIEWPACKLIRVLTKLRRQLRMRQAAKAKSASTLTDGGAGLVQRPEQHLQTPESTAISHDSHSSNPMQLPPTRNQPSSPPQEQQKTTEYPVFSPGHFAANTGFDMSSWNNIMLPFPPGSGFTPQPSYGDEMQASSVNHFANNGRPFGTSFTANDGVGGSAGNWYDPRNGFGA